MSRIHVLQRTGLNTYDCVVHSPTPAGNNSAGFAWSAVLANAGLNVTRMATGTGVGQITSAEAAQVAAGTVIETQFTWEDNPTWNNTQRLADLSTRADQAVAGALSQYAERLKFFGATVA
jgi:hypothetical protein